MITPYIVRLTDFSGEEKETDMHIDPNAIIQLQNEFNTIKQNTGETVTQYLARFNQIRHQIEAIEQGYYTNPQVLNQFIRGLKSSILRRVCSAHPNFLPEAITLTKALELAEKEANHSQMVNMVMEENKTETLEKRRNPNHAGTNQQTNPNYQNYQQTYLNIPKNLIIGNNDGRNINRTKNFSNKLSQTIPPAVATEDSSLAAIFLFKLEENKAMFSGTALDEKCPIIAMYTEVTVNNTPIKLILNSRSTGSIITLQLVNQLGFKVDYAVTFQIITANGSTKLFHGKIDSFPFEINSIVIPTKVSVMDATQYQALIGNNWLTKANATLNWTTQELLINYNSHQAKIPATCGHFQKPSANQKPTFKFEENSALPLECSVCKKKLLSITVYSAPDEDPKNFTYYYCNHCNKEKYGYPERHGKWDEKLCLACGEPLPRGCNWNDILDRGETCNTTYQYTILICNWVREETPFEAVFNRALKKLQHYPHNENKLYNTIQAKVKEGTTEEIRHWKESAEIANEVTSYNMFNPVDKFQDYYQQLCPT
ncbi:hypothetical protein G9A89_020267 [Geosiphon pyriformis]|nr:hypothetical protein G9A89_020267 [Geosiphon pyriformis]